jgi:hypothetical protein
VRGPFPVRNTKTSSGLSTATSEAMERRLAIHRNIYEVIAEVMRTDKSDERTFRRYVEATDQIPYLFGPEVEDISIRCATI